MTVAWLVRALAAGVLLAGAALCADRVAAWFHLPRRWTWAVAMAATLLLPLAAIAAPGLFPALATFVPEPDLLAGPAAPAVGAAPAGSSAAAPAAVPFGRVFAAGWMLASAAMLLVLARACRTTETALRGLPAGRLHGVRVRVAERGGPAAVGILTPEIVVPRWVLDAPEAESRLIVWHEREHVRAGDVRLLALAAAVLAAMPWHPALWWQYRRLRLAVETDCDARVLAAAPGVRRYAHALLRAAETPHAAPLLAPAWGGRPSHLQRRIATMTATRPAHRLPRTLLAAAAACALLTTACGITGSPEAERQARNTGIARVVDEGVDPDGRAYRYTDNGDGTGTMEVGPDPRTMQGRMGFSYDYDNPGIVGPGGDDRPMRYPPYVSRIDPGSPAARAGLALNDTILSSNGRDARLGAIFPDRTPGTAYTLRLRRNGVEREARLVVGPAPAQPAS